MNGAEFVRVWKLYYNGSDYCGNMTAGYYFDQKKAEKIKVVNQKKSDKTQRWGRARFHISEHLAIRFEGSIFLLDGCAIKVEE